eukprot:scaffold15261_cov78-Skeletonema_marinoi.AAC.1
MSADAKRSESDMMVCASCDKSEAGDIKLKNCACYLVKYCSLNVRRIIDRNINESAKNERLNCVMNCYSSNRKAAILGTVRYA